MPDEVSQRFPFDFAVDKKVYRFNLRGGQFHFRFKRTAQAINLQQVAEQQLCAKAGTVDAGLPETGCGFDKILLKLSLIHI
ncbi:hypothetical protein R80B4_02577 [Fibrobacteres bacterium R8-0-B4]